MDIEKIDDLTFKQTETKQTENTYTLEGLGRLRESHEAVITNLQNNLAIAQARLIEIDNLELAAKEMGIKNKFEVAAKDATLVATEIN